MPTSISQNVRGRVLSPGVGQGEALVLSAPLSLWGGLDPETGEIIDQRHPGWGHIVTGRVLVLPGGRGSSSASSVLLEAVRRQTAPAAILTLERDGILALGVIVARELYGSAPPLLMLQATAYQQIRTGHYLHVMLDGTIHIQQSTDKSGS